MTARSPSAPWDVTVTGGVVPPDEYPQPTGPGTPWRAAP